MLNTVLQGQVLLALLSFPGTLRLVVTVALGLTLIILAHEWGHYIVARLAGVRVEIFSILGFGPRLFGWRRGDTDFRFSLVPLGAYVKMAGESTEGEVAGAPDEFLSKTRWQRALILAAGPTMNVVCAAVFLFFIFAIYGVPEPTYLSKPAVLAGVLKNSPAERAGLSAGDRLVSLNGTEVRTWEDVGRSFEWKQGNPRADIKYERSGQVLNAAVSGDKSVTKLTELIGYPDEPVQIIGIVPGSPADRAGLKVDDVVKTADGQPVISVDQFVEKIQQSAGRTVSLAIVRDGHNLTLNVQPVEEALPDGRKVGRIGIQPGAAESHYRRMSPTQAASLAVSDVYGLTAQICGTVWQLIVGRASIQDLQGPVGIARISGQAAQRGIPDFVFVLALISLNLAIVNLLPIPMMDGGQLLLLGLEGARRRDFSGSFREHFLQVGIAFLLLLIVLVMYNDIRKLIPAKWLG